MKTKNIYIALVALFLLAAGIFGGIFFHQYNDGKKSQETFNELESMIAEPTDSTEETDASTDVTGEETDTTEPVDDEIAEALEALAKYQVLYEKNEDFVGWIKIDNTLISYPVMQSTDNPDFYLKHAFDKFYQGDASHKFSGNGLGLSIVKRILDLCGGDIALFSSPGHGTTATVTLPDRQTEEAPV